MQRMLSGGGQHFEQVVHLPTPSLEQRIDILRVLTIRIQVDELNLEELARAAPDGSSGCDLASCVKRACSHLIGAFIGQQYDGPCPVLTQKLLLDVITDLSS